MTTETTGMNLADQIEDYVDKGFLKRPNQIPDYIINNLAKDFQIRPYQAKAINNFILYNEDERLHNNKSIELLFHMATGSGKTYIMASNILYYYKKGYRNFLFFVDQTNIVSKTRSNFIDKNHQKYLFSKDIEIEGRKVDIKEVSRFRTTDPDSINIMFTTIQQLMIDLKKPKENSVTIADFATEPVVILSDEAHHMNKFTKTDNSDPDFKKNLSTWEEISTFVFGANSKNVLLEYTATIQFENEQLKNKYHDKVIIDYPLLEFREDNYTKEFFNVEIDSNPIYRTLLAILMSQYRLKLFEDIGESVKPVVLLKHSGVQAADTFYEEFIKFINHDLTIEHIEILSKSDNKQIKEMFKYYENKGLLNEILVTELKASFSEKNCLIVHNEINDAKMAENLRLINDLENEKNPIRLILTVNMLHEGWDVLNLFDIVRLYDTRQSGAGKISKHTVQEAQLIGRGVRYYPFLVEGMDEELKYIRKWNQADEEEYKICETLLYYSKTSSRYISELRQALKQTGFEASNKIDFKYEVKHEFTTTPIYKQGVLFTNKRIPITSTEIDQLPEEFNTITYYKAPSYSVNILGLMSEHTERDTLADERETFRLIVSEIDKRIIYRSFQKFKIFRLNVLKGYFPNLKSMNEFIESSKYLADYTIEISKVGLLENEDIYQGILVMFQELSNRISNMKRQYIGSKTFNSVPMKSVVTDIIRHKNNPDSKGEGVSQNHPHLPEELKLDLSKKEWFVFTDNFGTTEEKRLVKYFDSIYEKFKDKYEHVYLIRNERKLKIYSFKGGNRFEPDFILLLIDENDNGGFKEQHIYIEPKGSIYRHNDQWKENFLLELEDNTKATVYFDNDEYKILGLPFFTHDVDLRDFKSAIEDIYE